MLFRGCTVERDAAFRPSHSTPAQQHGGGSVLAGFLAAAQVIGKGRQQRGHGHRAIEEQGALDLALQGEDQEQPQQETKKDDNVVDADFEVVDD